MKREISLDAGTHHSRSPSHEPYSASPTTTPPLCASQPHRATARQYPRRADRKTKACHEQGIDLLGSPLFPPRRHLAFPKRNSLCSPTCRCHLHAAWISEDRGFRRATGAGVFSANGEHCMEVRDNSCGQTRSTRSRPCTRAQVGSALEGRFSYRERSASHPSSPSCRRGFDKSPQPGTPRPR